MPTEQKKLPSVLMLLLSALGILVSLLVALAALWGSTESEPASDEKLMLVSIGSLAVFLCLLNLPALILSIKGLAGQSTETRKPGLFKTASFTMIGWALLIVAGMLISQTGVVHLALGPITILAIAIPIWWLVEFARRGLERPNQAREANTLTLGLTLVPVIIMLIEILLVILISLAVVIILGIQPGTLSELVDISSNSGFSQGGMEELEQLLFNLAQDPTISAAIFLIIGVAAPLTEELLKPLAVWLFFKSPMKSSDGYSLGLISGAAFTLLESASMVSQISAQDWTAAVLLRSATSLLHISLSGLVGYGIARARNEKRWGFAPLYILIAAALHGLWNSLALLTGFSTTAMPDMSGGIPQSAGGIISIICMLVIFAAVVFITLKLGSKLRKQQASLETEIPA
jgi:RsiW-degrading membrane proteinase PrsW (M82 family)